MSPTVYIFIELLKERTKTDNGQVEQGAIEDITRRKGKNKAD